MVEALKLNHSTNFFFKYHTYSFLGPVRFIFVADSSAGCRNRCVWSVKPAVREWADGRCLSDLVAEVCLASEGCLLQRTISAFPCYLKELL